MYLEIDEGFIAHPKTLRLCGLLRDQNAWAYVIRLWQWACRSAPSGSLVGVEPIDIEIAAGYQKMDGALFAALSGRFIDVDTAGAPVALHDWMDYTGGAIKRMTDEADRKRALRAHAAGKCGGSATCFLCRSATRPEDVVRPASDVQGLSADGPKTGARTSDTVQSSPVQSRQDQDTEGDAAQEKPSETWDAFRWRTAFVTAWCLKYKRHAYGGGLADAKATGNLSDELATLPISERLAAQTRASSMIGEFLSDEAPQTLKARHPWPFFVTRFNGLISPVPVARGSPSDSEYCGSFHRDTRNWTKPSFKQSQTCPGCKHYRAANGERKSEPAPIPRIPLPNEWTPEQKAEAAELRKRAKEAP